MIEITHVNGVPVEKMEDGWINVKDGNPKDDGWYFCTYEANNKRLVRELYYQSQNGKWIDNIRVNMFEMYDIYGYGNLGNGIEKHLLKREEISDLDWTNDVIAWRPQPEPYMC